MELEYKGLTEGILKSVESSVIQNYSGKSLFVVKYKGVTLVKDGVRLFKTEGAAKAFLTNFVKDMFWHGEYWHSYRENIERQTGHKVDYSATIAILPGYGQTDRFDSPEVKKMFKDIAQDLLKEKIFTIESV